MITATPGCVSWEMVQLAQGRTTQPIKPSEIQKGDKVIELVPYMQMAYVVRHDPKQDESKAEMPDIPRGYEAYLAHPHPAYYGLLPVSIPFDIAVSPLYLLYGLVPIGAPPVSH